MSQVKLERRKMPTEQEKPKGLLDTLKGMLGLGPEDGVIPPLPWTAEADLGGLFTGASVGQTVEAHPEVPGVIVVSADARGNIKLGSGKDKAQIAALANAERHVAAGGEVLFESVGAQLVAGQVEKGRIIPDPSVGFQGSAHASVGSKPQPPEK